MSLSIQMRFDEAKALFDSMQFAANPMVTISFDDTNLANLVKQQQSLSVMQNLRGSIHDDVLGDLLVERQQDRQAEHIHG